MTEMQTDYELIMARVESGELGLPNLVEMILNERARNAVLVDAVREWQVLCDEAWSLVRPEHLTLGDETLQRLTELILWLALPWGDNDPLFPESDGWTPAALSANARLRDTWEQVVRDRDLTANSGAVPEPGALGEGDTDGVQADSQEAEGSREEARG